MDFNERSTSNASKKEQPYRQNAQELDVAKRQGEVTLHFN